MANSTVIDIGSRAAPSKTTARKFTESDAEDLYRNVTEARSICRVVALATAGLIDGSVQFDDALASRWEPAIDQACGRLRAVGAILLETLGAPNYNWWTPLNLLEALGAGLWHDHGPSHDALGHAELASFMSVAIESLDALLQQCEPAHD
jgi:hypothetical protein